jgi:alkylated DNA nucleotide flippase Atl1
MDALTQEIDDEVREAMDSLPDKYRSVVVLKDLDRYSYKEIALLAGVPVGTVMSRLYRGRKMLEKALMSFARRKGYLRSPAVFKQRDKSLGASRGPSGAPGAARVAGTRS